MVRDGELRGFQVGSSDSEGISLDKHVLAKDLAVLADKLSMQGFKLAYENWCWYGVLR